MAVAKALRKGKLERWAILILATLLGVQHIFFVSQVHGVDSPRLLDSDRDWRMLTHIDHSCNKTIAMPRGGLTDESATNEHPQSPHTSLRASEYSRSKSSASVGILLPPPPPKHRLPYDGNLSRAWPKRESLPCAVTDELHWWQKVYTEYGLKAGFLYTKIYKAASSTLSGIALQMARNLRKRLPADKLLVSKMCQISPNRCVTQAGVEPMCAVRFDHSTPTARIHKYAMRNANDTLLWTFVRNPTARAISAFFHLEVSRHKVEPKDQRFIDYLGVKENMGADLYLREMVYFAKERNATTERLTELAIQSYDFVGVVERMHESLVVMKLLWGLEWADLLFLPSKTAGGWDDGVYDRESNTFEDPTKLDSCVYIVPSFLSPGMYDFFDASPTWHKKSDRDWLVYRVANASLDLTIAALGKDIVDMNVRRYKAALKLASDACGSSTVWPCDAAGVRTPKRNDTDCMYWDSACGYKCFERLDLSRVDKIR